MKKLSELNKLDGLRVLGKITRVITPLTKDKVFAARARECFAASDKSDPTGGGLVVMLSFIDLLFNDAPEALLQIIGAVNGKEGDAVYEGDIFDAMQDVADFVQDEKLVSFFSKFFSSDKKQPST